MTFKATDGWSKVYEKIPVSTVYTPVSPGLKRGSDNRECRGPHLPSQNSRMLEGCTAEQTAKEGKASSGEVTKP